MVDPTKVFQSILDAIGAGEKAAGAFPKPKKSFTDVVKGALAKEPEAPKVEPTFPKEPPQPPATPDVEAAFKAIEEAMMNAKQFPGLASAKAPMFPSQQWTSTEPDFIKEWGAQQVAGGAKPLPQTGIDEMFKQHPLLQEQPHTDPADITPGFTPGGIPTKPPANVWKMSEHDMKTQLKPGDPVQAGEGGALGTFQGVSPGGTVLIDWKGKGAAPKSIIPGAVGPPAQQKYAKTQPGETPIPIKEEPPGETKIPVGSKSLWEAHLPNGFNMKDVGGGVFAVMKEGDPVYYSIAKNQQDAVHNFYKYNPQYAPGKPPPESIPGTQSTVATGKGAEEGLDPSLEMSEAAREKRRIKGGYTTKAYRGMRAPSTLEPAGYGSGKKKFYAQDPALAELYTRGYQTGDPKYQRKVYPFWLNTNDYHVFNAQGQSWAQISHQSVSEAKAAGKKGIIVHNVADEPDLTSRQLGPQTTYVVFDMSTVRQPGARFDPKKFSLGNTLATGGAIAVGGALGAALVQPQEAGAAPLPRVFHVSPNDFEAFGPLKERLGTGETAITKAATGRETPMAGPGIYMAEAEGVRDHYERVIKQATGGRAFQYENRIRADSEELIDLDKPIDQQPANVRLALEKLKVSDLDQVRTGDAQLAENLNREGVKGIQFFDKRSREKGEGTRNYVVFDPANIDILKKTKLAAVLGAGGAGMTLSLGGEAKAEEGQRPRPSFEDVVKGALGAPGAAPEQPGAPAQPGAAPAQPPANFMDTVNKALAEQKKAEPQPEPVDSRVGAALKILREQTGPSEIGPILDPAFFKKFFIKPKEEPSTIPWREPETGEGMITQIAKQYGVDVSELSAEGWKEIKAGAKEVGAAAKGLLAPFSHEKLVAYNRYEDELKAWEKMGDLEKDVVPKPQPPPGTGQAAIFKSMLEGVGGVYTAGAGVFSILAGVSGARTGAARPLETLTGLRHEVTEFVGGLALPGPEIFAVNKMRNNFGTVKKAANFVADQTNKVFAPEKLGRGEEAGTLLRAGTGSAARFTETARTAFNDYWNAVDAMPEAEQLGLTAYIEGRTGGAVLHDPSLQPVADAFRDQMEVRKTLLQNSPITSQMSFVEDYYPHMGWEDPAKAQQFVQNWFSKQGFGKNIKQRIIPTIADGIAAGLKPLTYNPLEMGMAYIQNMDRFIAHNNVFSAGRAAGHIKYALNHGAAGKPWNPGMDAKGWVPLQGRLSTKKTPAGEMVAYAPEEFARVYNNFVGGGFHGIQGPYGKAIGATYDRLQHASNAITGMELGLSAFHLFNEVNEAMASKGALALAQALGAIGALKGGQIAEAARLLRGSAAALAKAPLAPITTAIRGHKGQAIYMGRSPGTAQNRELIDLLEMAGGRAVGTHGQELEFRQTVGKSYLNSFRKLSDFIDKRAWKATGKTFVADYKAGKVFPAPVAFAARQIGRTLATFADPLFKTYIPKLKTGAFMDNMKVWLEANPGAAYPEKVAMAQKIWNSIDNRMGEMVQDNIFWPQMLKQAAKLGMRSFSWTLGTAREIGGGVKTVVTEPSRISIRGTGYDPKAGYVIAMPMMYFIANSVYQYMKTGKPPESIDDVLHARTGGVVPGLAGRGAVPERITMPSQMKDVFGWYEDWRREAYAKLSGMTQAGWEVLTNRDWRGDPIINPEGSAPEWLKDYFKYAERFLPISVRTEIQGEKRGSKITPTERRLGLRPAGTQWTDPEGLRRYKRYESMQLEKKRKKLEKRQQSVYGGPE